MSLKLLTTPDERLVCEEVVCALRAALWAQDKAPGEYDMADVLGL